MLARAAMKNNCSLGALAAQGGSMVNRIIPYLGRLPHVLHRLDMYTSGEFLATCTCRLFCVPARHTAQLPPLGLLSARRRGAGLFAEDLCRN